MTDFNYSDHGTSATYYKADPDNDLVDSSPPIDGRFASEAPVTIEDSRAELARRIEKINRTYALVIQGGGLVIMREGKDERNGRDVQAMSVNAFRTWMENEPPVLIQKQEKDGSTSATFKAIASIWFKSPDRRQYEGITFSPGMNAPNTYFNLWQGFAVEPLNGTIEEAKTRCRKLLDHVRDNLCNGNREHARYLMAWAADMVQDPGKKKGVALVLRGKKGTGKSMFVDALAHLFGHHSIKIAHGKQLTGNFNRHLADKLFVISEETYWAGDKGAEGALKDLITSDRITVEAKGVDAIELPSLCRIAMITNNDWAVPASADERRYFVLDVSDTRMQDTEYFSAIVDELRNGGYEALLRVLLDWNSGGLNLRNVPQTSGLQEQKALSFDPFERFVYDLLSGAGYGGISMDESTVRKDQLFEAYEEKCRKSGVRNHFTFALFCKRFMELSGAMSSKAARDDEGYRAPIFKLPGLKAARIAFATSRNMPDLFQQREA
ncbi:DUF5906 domain-containing protein [Rhizobium sp. OAE497]|uniref:DUF5906 domain-containing protein n=1 Tax=Rhizobium sp. OAE497 TaxID=2663796 RepID=UPI0018F74C04